jgi:hypothetical protein
MELNLMAVFTSREKPVLSRKIPEISSSPLRPDTLSSLHLEDVVEATAGPPHMAGLPHARVRRLGSSYRRDVSMSKTSHDACQISRIGWAWEWGLGC